jgi:GTP pyrophosphokinase
VVQQFSGRFVEAVACAVEWHATQARKGTSIPYVSHLLGAASIAIENGADEDEAIAALLHDAIEDCGAAYRDRIRDRFGARVAEIVDGCTDAETFPKPPWRERKERYLEALPKKSPSVHLVSCADKLHNARSLLMDFLDHGASTFDRFNAGKDDTLWYYRSLADAFHGRAPKKLSDELERVVSELERVAGSR